MFKFEENDDKVFCIKDSNVELSATFEALPKDLDTITIEWTRDGKPITNSEKHKITKTKNAIQLAIQHVQRDDAGHYTLYAKTDTGETSQKDIELLVEDRSFGDNPPNFIRRLNDLAAKVGTRTRLLVEIRSATDVRVTWYRNDRRICENDRINFVNEGSFYCLEISSITLDDGGKWMCMAENLGGRNSCLATLNVLVPKAYKSPEFIEELRAILTEQGTVSLECKVVGVPTPLLRWFKDSKEIKAGDVFALTANPNDDLASLGTYTCEAVNCMGKTYSSSKLHISGRASRESSLQPGGKSHGPPPIFTSELKNLRSKIGDALTLGCQVMVPPWPKAVAWYNKDGKIESSEKYKLIEDGLGSYILEIKPAEFCDEGEWKFVVTSSEGTVSITTCFVHMDVPKNYRKPRFMENLKAILTEEGLVSFECKVVGFPTPLLRWFKDGHELKPGDVYQLTGTNSLGSYSCIAKNCMGEATSSAVLTLEDIQNQLNENERIELQQKNQPPKFMKGLLSSETKINEEYKFTVQIKATTEPVFSWYRDDLPIDKTNERYEITAEKVGFCHLLIKCVEFVDQAEWKCVATNEYGHSTSTCFLKLQIPRHYKKPRFLECLRAVLTEEGAVNLECKVIGVPQPTLRWFKDGVELKPGDIHRIISGKDGACSLGTYTCEAKNCMGIVTSSATLLGYEENYKNVPKPEPPNLLQRHLSLSTIHEERTSQLYDTPMGDITVDEKGDVSFSFDGKEVSVSLYETPDLTEEEALQIVEMYADQISEHVTEQNIVELPPLRFVKETTQSGNLLMEAVVIDVSPDYFPPDEDMRTEADMEDISVVDPLSGAFEDPLSEQSHSKRRRKEESLEVEEFFSLSQSKQTKPMSNYVVEEAHSDEEITETDLQTFESAKSSQRDSDKQQKKVKSDDSLQEVPPALPPRKRQATESKSRDEDSIYLTDVSGEQGDGLKTQKKRIDITTITFNKTVVEIVRRNVIMVKEHLRSVENEVIAQSTMMMTPASADSSIGIVRSVLEPINVIESKVNDYNGERSVDNLVENLLHDLKNLNHGLSIIEKCVEMDAEGRTLVQRTSVCVIESVGEQMLTFLESLKQVCLNHVQGSLQNESLLIINDMQTGIHITEDTIKSQTLMQEASALEASQRVSDSVAQMQQPEFVPLEVMTTSELPKEANSFKLLCRYILKFQQVLESSQQCDVKSETLKELQKPINDIQNEIHAIEEKISKNSLKDTIEEKISFKILDTVSPPLYELNKCFEVVTRNVESGNKNPKLLEPFVLPLQEIQTGLALIGHEIDSGFIKKESPLDTEDNQKVIKNVSQNIIYLESNIENVKEQTSVTVYDSLAQLRIVITTLINDMKKEQLTKGTLQIIYALKEPLEELNYCFRHMEERSTSGSLRDLLDPLNSLKENAEVVEEKLRQQRISCHSDELKKIKSLVDQCDAEIQLYDIIQLDHQERVNQERMVERQLSDYSQHISEFEQLSMMRQQQCDVLANVQQNIINIQEIIGFERDTSFSEHMSTLKTLANPLQELSRQIVNIREEMLLENVNEISASDYKAVLMLAKPLREIYQQLATISKQFALESAQVFSAHSSQEVLKSLATPLAELRNCIAAIQHECITLYEIQEHIEHPQISHKTARPLEELRMRVEEVIHQIMEPDDVSTTLDDVSIMKTQSEMSESNFVKVEQVIVMQDVHKALINEQSTLSIKEEIEKVIVAIEKVRRPSLELQAVVNELNVALESLSDLTKDGNKIEKVIETIQSAEMVLANKKTSDLILVKYNLESLKSNLIELRKEQGVEGVISEGIEKATQILEEPQKMQEDIKISEEPLKIVDESKINKKLEEPQKVQEEVKIKEEPPKMQEDIKITEPPQALEKMQDENKNCEESQKMQEELKIKEEPQKSQDEFKISELPQEPQKIKTNEVTDENSEKCIQEIQSTVESIQKVRRPTSELKAIERQLSSTLDHITDLQNDEKQIEKVIESIVSVEASLTAKKTSDVVLVKENLENLKQSLTILKSNVAQQKEEVTSVATEPQKAEICIDDREKCLSRAKEEIVNVTYSIKKVQSTPELKAIVQELTVALENISKLGDNENDLDKAIEVIQLAESSIESHTTQEMIEVKDNLATLKQILVILKSGIKPQESKLEIIENKALKIVESNENLAENKIENTTKASIGIEEPENKAADTSKASIGIEEPENKVVDVPKSSANKIEESEPKENKITKESDITVDIKPENEAVDTSKASIGIKEPENKIMDAPKSSTDIIEESTQNLVENKITKECDITVDIKEAENKIVDTSKASTDKIETSELKIVESTEILVENKISKESDIIEDPKNKVEDILESTTDKINETESKIVEISDDLKIVESNENLSEIKTVEEKSEIKIVDTTEAIKILESSNDLKIVESNENLAIVQEMQPAKIIEAPQIPKIEEPTEAEQFISKSKDEMKHALESIDKIRRTTPEVQAIERQLSTTYENVNDLSNNEKQIQEIIDSIDAAEASLATRRTSDIVLVKQNLESLKQSLIILRTVTVHHRASITNIELQPQNAQVDVIELKIQESNDEKIDTKDKSEKISSKADEKIEPAKVSEVAQTSMPDVDDSILKVKQEIQEANALIKKVRRPTSELQAAQIEILIILENIQGLKDDQQQIEKAIEAIENAQASLSARKTSEIVVIKDNLAALKKSLVVLNENLKAQKAQTYEIPKAQSQIDDLQIIESNEELKIIESNENISVQEKSSEIFETSEELKIVESSENIAVDSDKKLEHEKILSEEINVDKNIPEPLKIIEEQPLKIEEESQPLIKEESQALKIIEEPKALKIEELQPLKIKESQPLKTDELLPLKKEEPQDLKIIEEPLKIEEPSDIQLKTDDTKISQVEDMQEPLKINVEKSQEQSISTEVSIHLKKSEDELKTTVDSIHKVRRPTNELQAIERQLSSTLDHITDLQNDEKQIEKVIESIVSVEASLTAKKTSDVVLVKQNLAALKESLNVLKSNVVSQTINVSDVTETPQKAEIEVVEKQQDEKSPPLVEESKPETIILPIPEVSTDVQITLQKSREDIENVMFSIKKSRHPPTEVMTVQKALTNVYEQLFEIPKDEKIIDKAIETIENAEIALVTRGASDLMIIKDNLGALKLSLGKIITIINPERTGEIMAQFAPTQIAEVIETQESPKDVAEIIKPIEIKEEKSKLEVKISSTVESIKKSKRITPELQAIEKEFSFVIENVSELETSQPKIEKVLELIEAAETSLVAKKTSDIVLIKENLESVKELLNELKKPEEPKKVEDEKVKLIKSEDEVDKIKQQPKVEDLPKVEIIPIAAPKEIEKSKELPVIEKQPEIPIKAHEEISKDAIELQKDVQEISKEMPVIEKEPIETKEILTVTEKVIDAQIDLPKAQEKIIETKSEMPIEAHAEKAKETVVEKQINLPQAQEISKVITEKIIDAQVDLPIAQEISKPISEINIDNKHDLHIEAHDEKTKEKVIEKQPELPQEVKEISKPIDEKVIDAQEIKSNVEISKTETKIIKEQEAPKVLTEEVIEKQPIEAKSDISKDVEFTVNIKAVKQLKSEIVNTLESIKKARRPTTELTTMENELNISLKNINELPSDKNKIEKLVSSIQNAQTSLEVRKTSDINVVKNNLETLKEALSSMMCEDQKITAEEIEIKTKVDDQKSEESIKVEAVPKLSDKPEESIKVEAVPKPVLSKEEKKIKSQMDETIQSIKKARRPTTELSAIQEVLNVTIENVHELPNDSYKLEKLVAKIEDAETSLIAKHTSDIAVVKNNLSDLKKSLVDIKNKKEKSEIIEEAKTIVVDDVKPPVEKLIEEIKNVEEVEQPQVKEVVPAPEIKSPIEQQPEAPKEQIKSQKSVDESKKEIKIELDAKALKIKTQLDESIQFIKKARRPTSELQAVEKVIILALERVDLFSKDENQIKNAVVSIESAEKSLVAKKTSDMILVKDNLENLRKALVESLKLEEIIVPEIKSTIDEQPKIIEPEVKEEIKEIESAKVETKPIEDQKALPDVIKKPQEIKNEKVIEEPKVESKPIDEQKSLPVVDEKTQENSKIIEEPKPINDQKALPDVIEKPKEIKNEKVIEEPKVESKPIDDQKVEVVEKPKEIEKPKVQLDSTMVKIKSKMENTIQLIKKARRPTVEMQAVDNELNLILSDIQTLTNNSDLAIKITSIIEKAEESLSARRTSDIMLVKESFSSLKQALSSLVVKKNEKVVEEQKLKEEVKPVEPEKPKVEEKVVETPKVEEKVVEVPKVDEKVVEVPKVEEKIIETPKVDEKIIEKPKDEGKVAQKPKDEEKVIETPKVNDIIKEPEIKEKIIEKPKEEAIIEKPKEIAEQLKEEKVIEQPKTTKVDEKVIEQPQEVKIEESKSNLIAEEIKPEPPKIDEIKETKIEVPQKIEEPENIKKLRKEFDKVLDSIKKARRPTVELQSFDKEVAVILDTLINFESDVDKIEKTIKHLENTEGSLTAKKTSDILSVKDTLSNLKGTLVTLRDSKKPKVEEIKQEIPAKIEEVKVQDEIEIKSEPIKDSKPQEIILDDTSRKLKDEIEKVLQSIQKARRPTSEIQSFEKLLNKTLENIAEVPSNLSKIDYLIKNCDSTESSLESKKTSDITLIKSKINFLRDSLNKLRDVLAPPQKPKEIETAVEKKEVPPQAQPTEIPLPSQVHIDFEEKDLMLQYIVGIKQDIEEALVSLKKLRRSPAELTALHETLLDLQPKIDNLGKDSNYIEKVINVVAKAKASLLTKRTMDLILLRDKVTSLENSLTLLKSTIVTEINGEIIAAKQKEESEQKIIEIKKTEIEAQEDEPERPLRRRKDEAILEIKKVEEVPNEEKPLKIVSEVPEEKPQDKNDVEPIKPARRRRTDEIKEEPAPRTPEGRRKRMPTFIARLKNRSAAENSILKLTCAISEPDCAVKWTKDGIIVKSSEKYSIENNNGVLSLEVKSVCARDAGEYCCFVSNVCGEIETSAFVTIFGEDVQQASTALKNLKGEFFFKKKLLGFMGIYVTQK